MFQRFINRQNFTREGSSFYSRFYGSVSECNPQYGCYLFSLLCRGAVQLAVPVHTLRIEVCTQPWIYFVHTKKNSH